MSQTPTDNDVPQYMVGLSESESFPIKEPMPASGIRPRREFSMLVTKKPNPAIRMLEGWAISVLMEAGAIRACEEHGWKKDRGDPHARALAFQIAELNRPFGVSPQAAAGAIAEALDSIGDTCPECPAE
jgi:hypothetical protein